MLELDADTGALVAAWGADLFLIPHSITVDGADTVWLTDVGRHQVLKFSHDGKLLLEIGPRGVPGWDSTHFNEPTDVVVARDGSFFVYLECKQKLRIAMNDRMGIEPDAA